MQARRKEACTVLSDVWLAYQEGIERFYDELAELLRKEGSMVYTERNDPEDVLNPELLLFNEHLCYDPNDDTAEEFLEEMEKKGYVIRMNFQARDAIIGNVVVKIENKWFAFGQCRRTAHVGLYVSDIWALRFVLTNLRKMEAKLGQAVLIGS